MRTTDLLTLQQWLSPAFPLGSFAYSHGLETEIAAGRVSSAATLEEWLTDILQHGTGRTDAILIRAAATGTWQDADILARTLAPSAERLQEALDQGAAFTRTTAAISQAPQDPTTFPVAFGRAVAHANLPVTEAIAAYLHAFTSNLVSAAVRLVPLGQTEGQAALTSLSATCLDIAETTQGTILDDIGSATFLADIASMRHETLSPRVFRT
ncbi:urease accessory protein UreF [Pseudaestuariivita sp.]|uniref:urease accessory protein UreF n=1 Tax=Pseudaestuariivita sp. TaxID=2211669 RepID=UPI00405A3B8C